MKRSLRSNLKLNNFYFYRPIPLCVTSIGVVVYDKKSEEYLMWQKIQKHLMVNYDLPASQDEGFDFSPRHTPICGVVDGRLITIPFFNDDFLTPKGTEKFKPIWERMGDPSLDSYIRGYSIKELYNTFFEGDKTKSL